MTRSKRTEKRELRIDLADPTVSAEKPTHPNTTARIGVGRAGARPRTRDTLLFSADHAVTQDAIMRPVDPDLLVEMGLLEVHSMVQSREAYLQRPDLGRLLSPVAVETLQETLVMRPDVQIFVGDGLSAAAIEHNVPTILPALQLALATVGLSVGQPFFVHNARVGLLNAVNGIVDAKVCMVLIGERPGLARAESLSIYVGFRPKIDTTDAHRNVISNIYAGGLPPQKAVQQAVSIAQAMIRQGTSGVELQLS
ncbi:MAG: ethanolamine ammonia-lyase subunit EutC [Candidatus Promineifilaceae bacterium]